MAGKGSGLFGYISRSKTQDLTVILDSLSSGYLKSQSPGPSSLKMLTDQDSASTSSPSSSLSLNSCSSSYSLGFSKLSSELPPSADPFTITKNSGFLPCRRPVTALPPPFEFINKLLDDMPIVKADGQPGLLADFKLGPLIDSGALPELTSHVDTLIADDGKLDLNLVTALFRDYSFIASAYLLEPCWEHSSKDNSAGYGLGRDVLPQCIAGPLVKAAEILDIPPFMSYAASYALYNFSLVDPARRVTDYCNLRLIRAFERGLDPSSSEAGFILTHIHMVAETPALVSSACTLLDQIEFHPSSIASIKETMQSLLSTMSAIEASMEKMWKHSQPTDYGTYRTFIFGITRQSMFPHGVTYASQFSDIPQFFRGESGANDSIIPLLDSLLQIPFPSNPLTDTLHEFKSYRPKPHREFLAYVAEKARKVGVREFFTGAAGAGKTSAATSAEETGGGQTGDVALTVLYLRLLDHVRSFRWRHWLFVREYVLKRTKHATATGGTDIVRWLPNQLGAVMELMLGIWDELRGQRGWGLNMGDEVEEKRVGEMMRRVMEQKERLAREVQKFCSEREC